MLLPIDGNLYRHTVTSPALVRASLDLTAEPDER
jgi:hypothetical protein